MINNDYLAELNARHQVDRLHADADRVRLIKTYRSLHPQHRFRVQLAAALRQLADRLAPEPSPLARPMPANRRTPLPEEGTPC